MKHYSSPSRSRSPHNPRGRRDHYEDRRRSHAETKADPNRRTYDDHEYDRSHARASKRQKVGHYDRHHSGECEDERHDGRHGVSPNDRNRGARREHYSNKERARSPSFDSIDDHRSNGKSSQTRDRNRNTHRRRSRSHTRYHSPSPTPSISQSPPRRRHGDRHRGHRSHAHHKSSRQEDGYGKPSRHSTSASPPPTSRRAKGPLPSQFDAFVKPSTSSTDLIGPDKPIEKQKPKYTPSGLLAAETNTVAGTSTILKYNEPPEARLPSSTTAPWRLYVFKGKDVLETIELFTRSCWLFGRERAVVDVPTEHPSCSKQHAVIQFRYVEKKVGEFGDKKGGVRPYIIDLESGNGTKVNGEAVPAAKYVELRTGDVVVFGESLREYVVLLPPKGTL